MKRVSSKAVRTVAESLLMVTFLMVSQAAMAQGFAAPVVGVMENIKEGIYAIIGVAAIILLGWQFWKGAAGQKTWADIGETSLWILGAAAVSAFVGWLWRTGGSISF